MLTVSIVRNVIRQPTANSIHRTSKSSSVPRQWKEHCRSKLNSTYPYISMSHLKVKTAGHQMDNSGYRWGKWTWRDLKSVKGINYKLIKGSFHWMDLILDLFRDVWLFLVCARVCVSGCVSFCSHFLWCGALTIFFYLWIYHRIPLQFKVLLKKTNWDHRLFYKTALSDADL